MNNNSKFKKFLIVVLCIFIAGMGFYGIGKFMGGTMYRGPYLKTNFDWKYDYDYSYEEMEYTGLDLSSVKEIHIDTTCATISIDGGSDRNSLTFANIKQDDFKVTLDKGVLRIDSNKKTCRNSATAPEFDLELNQVDVAEKLVINSGLGEVNVDNFKAKVFDIEASLGDIDLENIVSDDFTCIASLGEVDIEGDLRNSSYIEASLGSTYLSLKQPLSAYYYNIEVGLGSSMIDGRSSNGMSSHVEGGDSSSQNKLTIIASLGDVSVDGNQTVSD